MMAPTHNTCILEQSAVTVVTADGSTVIVQLTIHLPAWGRATLGSAAWDIFDTTLPEVVRQCFLDANCIDIIRLWRQVASIGDRAWLQGQLQKEHRVAFVRNGAILPRASGVDDRPQSTNAVITFVLPPSLERSFQLPKSGGATITGMAIPHCITLICGGGYHGKSTKRCKRESI